jgi:hypothetical protein
MYVFTYTVLRNYYRLAEIDNQAAIAIKCVIISCGICYTVFSFYLFTNDKKMRWDISDYLSPVVLVVSAVIIAILEFWFY